ncbi:MAG: hypothetical protein AAB971_01275 [Patescibacteria group bacterium]
MLPVIGNYGKIDPMNKHNQDGAIGGLGLSLVFACLLLVGAISFGAWAFASRQDYKENVEAKINLATEAARQRESKSKDKQFAEESKKPLKIYRGPEASGSVMVSYPKTWSGYVAEAADAGSSDDPLDGYFAPGIVPTTDNKNSVFALRVKIVNQEYKDVLESFGSQQQAGKLTASVYSLPKLPKVVGVKVVGELPDQSAVTMIVLPLRSQTLQIWTQGTQYLSDFNDNILPNFSFSP